MFSTIKSWLYAAGVLTMGILYVLFKNERAERKKAELEAKVHKSNADLAVKQIEAADKAIAKYRERKNKLNRKYIEAKNKAAQLDVKYENDEITDDQYLIDARKLLNENADQKSSGRDS